MKSLLSFVLALVLGGGSLFAAEKSSGRGFISRMLDPATRMEAFRKFRLDGATDDFWRERWSDSTGFANDHAKLQVTEVPQLGGAPSHYLVTHSFFGDHEISPERLYSTASFDRLFPAPEGGAALAFSGEPLLWYLFDAQGKPLVAGDNAVFAASYIHDLNGDGRIEVAEVGRATLRESPPLEADVIRIGPKASAPAPDFAVAFNLSGEDEPTGEEWGHCFVRVPQTSSYELRLGPMKDAGIEPAVVFRWDARKREWTPDGPAKAGANWRILDAGSTPLSFSSGSGGSVRHRQARDVASLVVDRDLHDQLAHLPADALSNPYRAGSLAHLGHAELLAWMKPGRNTYDLGEELARKATLPQEIWTLEPKAAALRFVEANRPPSMRRHFRLAVDDLDGQPAPEEGSASISDGPSGCYAPGGNYEYHLRCARSGSALVVARSHSRWADFTTPLFKTAATYELRTIPLDYAEAKHLLQTLWWLDRVRSKPLGKERGDGGMGSTSNGWATFRLESPAGRIEISSFRWAVHAGRFAAIGDIDATYDRTACLNAAVRLVCEAFPLHLGDRWKQAQPAGCREIYEMTPAHSATPHYPRAQWQHLEARVRELVALFNAGSLGPEAARVVVSAAGNLQLIEVRPALEKMATLLPETGTHEREIAEIDVAIRKLRATLGPVDTDSSASWRRRNAAERSAAPGEPSPILPDPAARPAKDVQEVPPPDPKYGALDALDGRKDELERKQPHVEKVTASLREEIADTLRWFDICDDPERVFRWTVDPLSPRMEGVIRLHEIAPRCALEALQRIVETRQDWERSHFERTLEYLESALAGKTEEQARAESTHRSLARLTGKAELSNLTAQAKALVAVLTDSATPLGDLETALNLLVPPTDPLRYDESVDEALLTVAKRQKGDVSYFRSRVCLALAVRGGGQHWNSIIAPLANAAEHQMSPLPEMLPALDWITLREPEPYRSRLLALLRPNFTRTKGNVDRSLWSTWNADLRQLQPEIEALATSSPADIEGHLAGGSSNQASDVSQRFHLARQIASLWSEPDAVTRAKLLVAFAVGRIDAENIASATPPAQRERYTIELSALAKILNAEQRQEVLDFIAWCAAEAGGTRETLTAARMAFKREQ